MVKVRIQGVPEEVQRFIDSLKAADFELLQVTNEYENRGSSKYVRVYADIQNKTDRTDVANGKG